MRKFLSLVAIGLAASLGGVFVEANSATIASIGFDQVDYYQDGKLSVPNSEWGQFTVSYNQDGSLQWLNIVNTHVGSSLSDGWIIQNHPLLPSGLTNTASFVSSSYFDLSVSRDTDLAGQPLDYYYTITDVPLGSRPATGMAGTQLIGSSQNIINSGVPSGDVTLNSPQPSEYDWRLFLPEFDVTWHKGMPNVIQQLNWCGPGAAANSLHWLDVSIQQTLEDTMIELAGDMNNRNDGNWDDAEVSGKLAYIDRYGLPLEVHYAGGEKLPLMSDYVDPNGNGSARNDGKLTTEWLAAELARGQDIELMTRTHWVVLEGIIRVGDFALLSYRDDPFQHGDLTTPEEEDVINSRHVWTTFYNGKTNIGNGTETALAAVAESPVPGPLPLLGVGAAFGSIRKLRKFSSQLKTFSMS